MNPPRSKLRGGFISFSANSSIAKLRPSSRFSSGKLKNVDFGFYPPYEGLPLLFGQPQF